MGRGSNDSAACEHILLGSTWLCLYRVEQRVNILIVDRENSRTCLFAELQYRSFELMWDSVHVSLCLVHGISHNESEATITTSCWVAKQFKGLFVFYFQSRSYTVNSFDMGWNTDFLSTNINCVFALSKYTNECFIKSIQFARYFVCIIYTRVETMAK